MMTTTTKKILTHTHGTYIETRACACQYWINITAFVHKIRMDSEKMKTGEQMLGKRRIVSRTALNRAYIRRTANKFIYEMRTT